MMMLMLMKRCRQQPLKEKASGVGVGVGVTEEVKGMMASTQSQVKKREEGGITV